VDETRLPDPRLANKEDDLAAPVAGAVEAVLELANLAIAADEWR
jgi:hypothetical protein